MYLAQMILILQMTLGLLANPQIQSNPAFKAQALSFANTAMSMTQQALQISGSSDTPTSTPIQTPDLPTSTVPQTPIYIYVPYAPPVPTSTPVFGTTQEATSTPVVTIPNPVLPTIYAGQSLGSDYAVFTISHPGIYDDLQVQINGQTLDFPNSTTTGARLTIKNLTSNTDYPYNLVATNGGKSVSKNGSLTTLKDISCNQIDSGFQCMNNSLIRTVQVIGVSVSSISDIGQSNPSLSLYDPITGNQLLNKQYPPSNPGIGAYEPIESVTLSNPITLPNPDLTKSNPPTRVINVSTNERFTALAGVNYTIDGIQGTEKIGQL